MCVCVGGGGGILLGVNLFKQSLLLSIFCFVQYFRKDPTCQIMLTFYVKCMEYFFLFSKKQKQNKSTI